jgi:hypothetical protein
MCAVETQPLHSDGKIYPSRQAILARCEGMSLYWCRCVRPMVFTIKWVGFHAKHIGISVCWCLLLHGAHITYTTYMPKSASTCAKSILQYLLSVLSRIWCCNRQRSVKTYDFVVGWRYWRLVKKYELYDVGALSKKKYFRCWAFAKGHAPTRSNFSSQHNDRCIARTLGVN